MIRLLHDRRIDWILSGSAVLILYGAELRPNDLDVVPALDDENLQRLPGYLANADNWLTAFYLAILCREQGRMTMLAEVPIGLLRASGVACDEVVYDWIDTLQTYWKEGPDIGAKLNKAIDGTDPDRPSIVGRAYMLRIVYPPMIQLYRILLNEPGKFDAALIHALELHREFWSSDMEGRSMDARGLVALAPLALACLAHDGGLSVDVESPFLPTHVLKRDWLGEFDTWSGLMAGIGSRLASRCSGIGQSHARILPVDVVRSNPSGEAMRIMHLGRAAVAAALLALGLLAGSGVANASMQFGSAPASTDWTSAPASTDWTGTPDSVRITGEILY